MISISYSENLSHYTTAPTRNSPERRVPQLHVHRAGHGVPRGEGKKRRYLFFLPFFKLSCHLIFFWRALHDVRTHVWGPSVRAQVWPIRIGWRWRVWLVVVLYHSINHQYIENS